MQNAVLAGRSGNCARVWLPADDMEAPFCMTSLFSWQNSSYFDLNQLRFLVSSLSEITVVTASNVPPKPIIAVHAGGVRRQMKLEAFKSRV